MKKAWSRHHSNETCLNARCNESGGETSTYHDYNNCIFVLTFADKIDEKRLVRDFFGARHTGKYVAATKKSNNRFSQF